jgi:hypothetical protein
MKMNKLKMNQMTMNKNVFLIFYMFYIIHIKIIIELKAKEQNKQLVWD